MSAESIGRFFQLSESVEWYTSAHILEAARATMGGIDLDPASSAEANEAVRATRYHTAADDGLLQPWSGRVWLNPPYGRGIGPWTERLRSCWERHDIEAGMALVPNCTETRWFLPLWRATAICFLFGRRHFVRPASRGDGGSMPTKGSCVAYFGESRDRFADVFRPLGVVVSAEQKKGEAGE